MTLKYALIVIVKPKHLLVKIRVVPLGNPDIPSSSLELLALPLSYRGLFVNRDFI